MGKKLVELHQQLRELERVGVVADLKERVLSLAEGGVEQVSNQPLTILKIIAFAAEWEFSLNLALLNGMREAAGGLAAEKPEQLRENFEDVLMAKYASAGMQMAFAVGVFPFLLGEECFPPKSKVEQNDFALLMEHIDKTAFHGLKRYALLFLCFEKTKAEDAVRRLKFPPEEEELLLQVPKLVMELHFVVRPLALKRFLATYGRQTYDFIESVTKQQRKVYDQEDSRIMSRYYILIELDKMNVPIYIEDLKVSEKDLEEVGITDERLKKEIMEVLLNDVHNRPHENRRDLLLKRVGKYRSPLVRAWRKVTWMK